MEKRKPAFILADVQTLIKNGAWNMTRTSWMDAHALGYGKDDVQGILLDLTPEDFYKSMSSIHNAAIWQDVYHKNVDVNGGRLCLYVKLQVQGGNLSVVVSFKEK